MKKVIIAFLCLLFPLMADAQTDTTRKDHVRSSRAFEVDFKLWNSFGTTNMDHLAHIMLGAEFRYNLRKCPVSVGFNGGWSLPFSMEPVEAGSATPVGTIVTYDCWNVFAFADYNFFADRAFSPYLGLGVGGGKGHAKILKGFEVNDHMEATHGIYRRDGRPIVSFALRAGFEIKSIYRISLEEYFNTDGSRGFQFTFAFVLPKGN
jgi:opacity protein-like surface antigen